MTFQWATGKALLNLKNHRVDFADTATVFGAPRALTRDDPDFREDRFLTLGFDALGRLLDVSWTARNDDFRVISALSATSATSAEARHCEKDA